MPGFNALIVAAAGPQVPPPQASGTMNVRSDTVPVSHGAAPLPAAHTSFGAAALEWSVIADHRLREQNPGVAGADSSGTGVRREGGRAGPGPVATLHRTPVSELPAILMSSAGAPGVESITSSRTVPRSVHAAMGACRYRGGKRDRRRVGSGLLLRLWHTRWVIQRCYVRVGDCARDRVIGRRCATALVVCDDERHPER